MQPHCRRSTVKSSAVYLPTEGALFFSGFFFSMFKISVRLLENVSDVDLKAISGSVIATGPRPVLPPLRSIKCNITRPVSSVCSAYGNTEEKSAEGS